MCTFDIWVKDLFMYHDVIMLLLVRMSDGETQKLVFLKLGFTQNFFCKEINLWRTFSWSLRIQIFFLLVACVGLHY